MNVENVESISVYEEEESEAVNVDRQDDFEPDDENETAATNSDELPISNIEASDVDEKAETEPSLVQPGSESIEEKEKILADLRSKLALEKADMFVAKLEMEELAKEQSESD